MTSSSIRVLEALGSGVVAVDAAGLVLFVNSAFSRYSGIAASECVGRPFAALAGELEARLGPQARPSLEGEASSREVEWRTENGILYLREDRTPLLSADGVPSGLVLAYHDIRREKAIDRMKSEFISVASHELRTPMTSIKGSVNLILSGFSGQITADTQELLEIAQKNCDRLIRLINDILDIAKIEAGQIKLKLGPVNLAEAARRAMRGVKSLADQHSVVLRLECPEPVPAVEGDRDRIDQVITNLLGNAIKFSPPEGEVCISISAVDNAVQCAVQDQGCGIAESDLSRVFGKFQQVGESSMRGGTGLGLAIAQALVNEHKGKLWVESEINHGSRFIFQLPVPTMRAAEAAG